MGKTQNHLTTTAENMIDKFRQEVLFSKEKQHIKSIAAFIDEILRAEKRISIKQSDIHKQRTAIYLFKESILIRELFSDIARHFDLENQLSNQQYSIVKRVWNKAFDTAVYTAKHIHSESTIKNIEKQVTHVFTNKKALH